MPHWLPTEQSMRILMVEWQNTFKVSSKSAWQLLLDPYDYRTSSTVSYLLTYDTKDDTDTLSGLRKIVIQHLWERLIIRSLKFEPSSSKMACMKDWLHSTWSIPIRTVFILCDFNFFHAWLNRQTLEDSSMSHFAKWSDQAHTFDAVIRAPTCYREKSYRHFLISSKRNYATFA